MLRTGNGLAVTGPVTDGVSVGLTSVGGDGGEWGGCGTERCVDDGAGGDCAEWGGCCGERGIGVGFGGGCGSDGGGDRGRVGWGAVERVDGVGSGGEPGWDVGGVFECWGVCVAGWAGFGAGGRFGGQQEHWAECGGRADVGGSLTAPAVDLVATGAIVQSGGGIVTPLLTGSGAGVALEAAGNAVAGLGAFGSTGGFSLVDGTALGVSGAVQAVGTLSLMADAIQLLGGGVCRRLGGLWRWRRGRRGRVLR